MKVTALIDDQLIKDVKEISKGDNITESLVIALKDWVATKRLMELSRKIKEKPVSFKEKNPAAKLRALSRRRA